MFALTGNDARAEVKLPNVFGNHMVLQQGQKNKVWGNAEHGEAVTITRNGAAFATLAPAKPAKPRKVDWAAWLKKHPPVGRGMSKAATEKLWSDLRD